MKNVIRPAQAINEQFQAIEREYADLIYYSSLTSEEIKEINFFNNLNYNNDEK